MGLIIKDVQVPVVDQDADGKLTGEVATLLGVKTDDIKRLEIKKKSLDARRKGRIVYHYQVVVDFDDEDSVLNKNQAIAEKAPLEKSYHPLDELDLKKVKFRHKPVIIGTGPAGTFAALVLAKAGQSCLVIERGEAVEGRLRTVNKLRRDGSFAPESNYCFGEGGAGTFSDGKLTCGRNHPLIKYLFDQWVEFGSPKDILYDAHPHIGTDYLMVIAKNMRTYLEANGAEFLFNKRFVDFNKNVNGARYEVILDDGSKIPTDHLILAVGHSARDTYQMLLEQGVAMQPKPFAIGARIEHPQEVIDRIQFGSCNLLPAAEYKLAAQTGARGIWTFCMCPGGHLLPTSAQAEHLAINGMSYHARKSGFANAAVVVGIQREDFFRGHPLDGMRFQENLERLAFKEGGGNYHSPAQRLEDFIAGRKSLGELKSTYKPGVTSARLDKILPDFVVESLKAAVQEYNKKMRGYISSETMVVGLESKTSAPIQMLRDKDSLQSLSHPGLFPAGEGAGFAGGIVSAALDGVKIGRAVVEDGILHANILN